MERVSYVLNEGLKHVNLNEYDYILRVDCDTLLPIDFVEKNLQLNADAVGFGHAHLIKVSTFLKVMNGKFHSVSDDSYLNFKFMKEGYTWAYWNTKPVMVRDNGKTYGLKYFFERGKLMWQLGYEPLHVFGNCRWTIKNVLAVAGYFSALANKVKRFDVADFVFRYQQIGRAHV